MNANPKDFNALFWKIWGVNHRIYEVLEVFNIKRDKSSDEKRHNNFINDDHKLSNQKYFYKMSDEICIFSDLICKGTREDSENIKFCINQIENITSNYRFFQTIRT